MKLQQGLYIVSTPIGNMDDITYRAVKTLSNSDYILAEDTRVTKRLLDKHQISTKLMVYNDHSDDKKRVYIQELIQNGAIISLVSDAGTPLISDPGYKLLHMLQNNGFFVDIVPGVCSPIAALTISTLPTDKFIFCGFLPKTRDSRESCFKKYKAIEATLIFFESATRLTDSIIVAQEVLGDREAVVARELTKLYQDVQKGKLSELYRFYSNSPAKGEVVFLVSGITDKTTHHHHDKIRQLLDMGISAKDIVKIIMMYDMDSNKNLLYKLVNDIKSDH